MIAKAVSKYIRISPRKAMLVTRPLKGMSVPNAFSVLSGINQKAAYFVNMTLKSAVDNARKKDKDLNESALYISKIAADAGPMLKRFRAGTMGRAFNILKRTCHLTIELSAKEQPRKEISEAKKAVRTKPVAAKTVKAKETKSHAVKATSKKERR
ncbi:MAG: 50S ribosomal protein L22 [Candidatus Omnitrophica bacterium]|nr:50S ribosomal protein L22 [Candidatus Omnitrophota bacterium]